MAEAILISSCVRTAMGGLQGSLSAVPATVLGTVAVQAAVARSRVPAGGVDQVIMGCVLPAGLGQAPARQVAIGAALGESVPATTINKMCGSGMQAVIMAGQAIASGSADIVAAGGMESMSNAPYLLARHRRGARIGHDIVQDSMFLDGLEDAYAPGRLMGAFAEEMASEFQLSRAMQDAFALESLRRARAAIASGAFAAEIVSVPTSAGAVLVDEQPAKANEERVPTLKPAFAVDGTITAANASSISDGAAALVLARSSVAERAGLAVAARLVAHAVHAQAPSRFASAPGPAVRAVLERAGWRMDDVDLFEINEAFAAVALIAMRELGIPHDRLNVNGGACALGHPIGASGARIIVTLIAALRARGLRRGVAAICIGGGEATAVALELV